MNQSSSNASQESLEALAFGDKAATRQRVLGYVRACGQCGTTADEACAALGLGHNSTAPSLTELLLEGHVVKLYDANGRVWRETRQGCQAGVIVAAEFAGIAAPAECNRLFPDAAPPRHLDLG